MDCEAVAKSLTPANYDKTVFGLNQTVTVGLTQGLYAVTDGTNIQYFNHYDSTISEILPNAWPVPIDVGMGVAAVTYFDDGGARDGQGDASTTMLGCRCLDNNGAPPMRIECALAMHEVLTYGNSFNVQDELVFEVGFQQQSTANYMTCLQSEISVQSVRWPATRFTRLIDNEDDLDTTCQSKGTCNYVDASIWVAPLCTSTSDRVPEVCVSIFKGASCFPYCMAARRTGSRANGLILYDARDWKERVHIMDRNCGVIEDPVKDVDEGNKRYDLEGEHEEDRKNTVRTVTYNDILSGAVKSINWDPVSGCKAAPMSESQVGLELHDSYKNGRFRSLLMPGQPFAFAGDTTLTSVRDSEGNYFVSVDRLYGDQSNEFTMVRSLLT